MQAAPCYPASGVPNEVGGGGSDEQDRHAHTHNVTLVYGESGHVLFVGGSGGGEYGVLAVGVLG